MENNLEKSRADTIDAKPAPNTQLSNVADDEKDVIHFFTKQNSPNRSDNINKIDKIVNLENVKYYDMTHEKRGIALIFNHMTFKSLPARGGTNIDRDEIKKSLELLGFTTICCNDFTRREVVNKLWEVSEMDHSMYDCLLVVVMSHGEKGVIYARDVEYPVDYLWESFMGNKCDTLVGKPKLFLIQACRGSELDGGVQAQRMFSNLNDVVDAIPPKQEPKPLLFLIPTMADLLTMYSTYDGYYAWRNPNLGSWFIQAVCAELNENGQTEDLLTILTGVSRRVAYEYKSNVPTDKSMDSMKQMPCIVSMLTKTLYFTKKKQNK